MFHCKFCTEVDGQFSTHSLVIHTEGRAVERKTNGEVPKRQGASGDDIPSSQNTLLLRQVFASEVVEKTRHQEPSALVNLSVLQSGYYKVLLKTVLKVWYIHSYSPDSAQTFRRSKDFPGLMNSPRSSCILKLKIKH